MTSKDSSSKRLAAAFKLKSEMGEYQLVAKSVEGPEIVQRIPWEEAADDPQIAMVLYRRIFSLATNFYDPLLESAFADAALDSKNPFHWRKLLYLFVWAHFGDRPKLGRPKEWDSVRLSQLRQDFNDKKSRNRALSDEDVFKFLGKNQSYQRKGRPLSPSRLSKLLKLANDPNYNELLRADAPNISSTKNDV